ncbi:MAG: FadR family transcriptional regulator [Blautia sp.]|nr:FadR family transcriptional regulator [Blautia sp.]MCM1201601.1 FadR family transcriptional regulator [Bacteroides fragilis]
MYQIEKMNQKLLAPQVEEELMNYILHEPVGIGEKIPNEYELASRFGVGRSTIREAVRSLATKGILEVRRGSGTYVVSTSSMESDPLGLEKFTDKYKLGLELFEVRLMLEPEIAALASVYATPEEKEELKRLCDETERLYLSGKNHTEMDVAFHTCIARCSRNRVVEQLLPIIQTAIVTFVNLTHRRLMEETIETHRAILEAITKGDSVGARCAMIMHLTYNRQMLIRMKEGLPVQEKQGRSDE